MNDAKGVLFLRWNIFVPVRDMGHAPGGPYWIYRSDDVPDLTTIFIETYEESGPFGAKAVAEIPLDGAGPAIANAVYDAVGVLIKDAPLLPEKVWRALQEKKS